MVISAFFRERRILIFSILYFVRGDNSNISLQQARSVLVKSNLETNENRIQTLLQFYVRNLLKIFKFN